MRVNESVITVPELDNYDALVNAALGAAYTRSLNYRPGSTMLPPEANVTLTYAPAVSKGGAKNAPGTPLRQRSANVTVSAAAPTTYARGQVWLCTDSTLPGHRTFFLSLATSPAAEVWFPLSDPSLLFAQDRALVLGDTATASSGGGGSVTINNTLTSTSTTSALSAAQGKVLQDTKAPRGGPGAALGDTYTAVDADDGKIWPTPVDCAVTVNTGLIAGFGQGFTGAGVVSFTGTATVADKRTPGATDPVCSLVNIGTNTYEAWGTKQ